MIPKFRAWDKRRQRMIEVTSINFRDGNIQEETRYAVNRELYLDDVVLMQYTGLKDQEGTEIYEGDVVNYFVKSNSIIEWKNGGFIIKRVIDGAYELIQSRIAEIEVLGNIYENPELLEGE